MSIEYSVGCFAGYIVRKEEIYSTENNIDIVKHPQIYATYFDDVQFGFDVEFLENGYFLVGKKMIDIDPANTDDSIIKIQNISSNEINELFDFNISKIPNAEFGIWFFNKSF